MATIVFPEHPSPVADAQVLRKACEGLGTDEKSIISILAHRNWIQRKLIREAYEQQYQQDLVKRLEKELSGSFERAVYRWILEPADRDAVLLNVAITKASRVDCNVIIEMACIHCPEEFLGVKRAYQARYKRSLEEDLAHHTSGDIRKLLVGLASVYRYNGGDINAKLADKEAHSLHKALTGKEFSHDEVLRILTTRSKAQVLATVNRYKDVHGISITKHLRDVSDTDYLAAVRTIIQCVEDHQKYFEKVLRKAINKSGTDEDALTRVIVTRAEKDLLQIKEHYHKRNSVSLEHAVSKETYGDYKAFLLALVGNQD